MVAPMNKAELERHNEMYRKVVARAWGDPAFKAKLLSDPHAAFAAAGIPLAAGKTVRVLENTDEIVHIVLPARPGGELSDAELEHAAGGNIIHSLLPAV
jgi:hypothetical protein